MASPIPLCLILRNTFSWRGLLETQQRKVGGWRPRRSLASRFLVDVLSFGLHKRSVDTIGWPAATLILRGGTCVKLGPSSDLPNRRTRKSPAHVQGCDLKVAGVTRWGFSPPASTSEYRRGIKGPTTTASDLNNSTTPQLELLSSWTVPGPPATFRGGSLHSSKSRTSPVWPRNSIHPPQASQNHPFAHLSVIPAPLPRSSLVVTAKKVNFSLAPVEVVTYRLVCSPIGDTKKTRKIRFNEEKRSPQMSFTDWLWLVRLIIEILKL
ncbi:hypothetical protein LCGC14_2893130, partial [marine sediment metagenome]